MLNTALFVQAKQKLKPQITVVASQQNVKIVEYL